MIETKNFGKHENVVIATFGTGDVRFTRARWMDEKHERLLLFFNEQTPRKIGEVSQQDAGKSSDDCDKPAFVMEFNKPESITALIHSLVELQKELFDRQEWMKVEVKDAKS